MDITLSSRKRYATPLMNGETVNYLLSFSFSFFILIVIKQALKTFLGADTAVACAIGFAAAETALFLLQSFFVFTKSSLNSMPKQIIFSVLNAGVHLGIYAAISFAGRALGLYSHSIWLACFLFLLVLNYPVSRILIFDCALPAKESLNGRIYKRFFENRFVFLSMGVALLCMLFILLVFACFPFGDTTVLRMDLYHQYGPLFTELFDRVTQGRSFLYSWTSGGGSSFLGNYFNYLSSPFTAIIFLFDRDEMPFAITAIVTAKCTVSAGTFAYYIKKSLKRHSAASAAFGVFYAFCAYFLAYFWNIMWLDGMMMLPLLALGIERIVNTGKGLPYLLVMVYIFYSSYYIGYMCCIFAVVYFLAYFLISPEKCAYTGALLQSDGKIKRFFKLRFIAYGARFALCSLLAGALCAFFLLPVYGVLTGSSATSDSAPAAAESYFSLLDFIQTHFAGLETTIRSSGNDVLPNVYTSVLTLLLLPLFYLNGRISFREKAAYTLLIVFFFVSFNLNFVNFFWHAFHFPNDLPYRFSFMYSFVLLTASFRALEKLRFIKRREIMITAFIWLAFIAATSEMSTEKMSGASIYLTAAFIIIYAAFLYLLKSKKAQHAVMSVLVTALAFCEVIICDPKAFNFNQTQGAYTENYAAYTDASEYIKAADDGDYRAELCSLNTRMDPCLYGYNGMSIFSSMAYESYSGLQYSLGMYGNRINSYTYNTQTPVYNMMYNIKYLIYREENTRPSTEYYTKFYDGDGVTVFSNDYFLPKAFCVNSALSEWYTQEGDPFAVQESFFDLATGYKNVFRQAEYVNTSYTGLTGPLLDGTGAQWVNRLDGASYCETTVTLQAAVNGNLYIYVDAGDVNDISVSDAQDTRSFNISTPYIIDLGYYDAGETVTVSLDCSSLADGESRVGVYAYSVDKAVLDAGYERLNAGAMTVEEHTDTKISGTVTAAENCILYTSIPFDEGWSVYIDGEKAETFEIGGCQLAVMLKPGEHSVEFKYTPKLLVQGAAISAAAALGCAAAIIIKKQRKKRDLATKVTNL